MYEKPAKYYHNLGALDYWLFVVAILYIFCMCAFYASTYIEIGYLIVNDISLDVLLKLNALKPVLIFLCLTWMALGMYDHLGARLLFVFCAFIYACTFATGVKLLVNRFFNCNSPYYPYNICNDPLYCCAYYDLVPVCSGLGPCIGTNITSPNDLIPNPDMERFGIFFGILLFLEFMFVIISLSVLSRLKILESAVIITNELLRHYYETGNTALNNEIDDDTNVINNEKEENADKNFNFSQKTSDNSEKEIIDNNKEQTENTTSNAEINKRMSYSIGAFIEYMFTGNDDININNKTNALNISNTGTNTKKMAQNTTSSTTKVIHNKDTKRKPPVTSILNVQKHGFDNFGKKPPSQTNNINNTDTFTSHIRERQNVGTHGSHHTAIQIDSSIFSSNNNNNNENKSNEVDLRIKSAKSTSFANMCQICGIRIISSLKKVFFILLAKFIDVSCALYDSFLFFYYYLFYHITTSAKYELYVKNPEDKLHLKE